MHINYLCVCYKPPTTLKSSGSNKSSFLKHEKFEKYEKYKPILKLPRKLKLKHHFNKII